MRALMIVKKRKNGRIIGDYRIEVTEKLRNFVEVLIVTAGKVFDIADDMD